MLRILRGELSKSVSNKKDTRNWLVNSTFLPKLVPADETFSCSRRPN